MTTMTVGYPGQGATVVQAIAAPANAASAQAQMQHQAQVLAAHAHAAAVAAGAPTLVQAPQPTHQQHPVHDPQGMVSSAAAVPEGGQLTLSFQGKSYAYDGVKADKLDQVLQLLNDETRSFVGAAYGTAMAPGTAQGYAATAARIAPYPYRKSSDQRQISLNRFREKRKERSFDKKIRYSVRKEVAEKMNRNKGQFAPSQKDEEGAEGVEGGDGSTSATCTHCGAAETQTPMMRKGPQGPRTLCNACGLMWANKGCMRDLSKSYGRSPQASGGPARASVAAPDAAAPAPPPATAPPQPPHQPVPAPGYPVVGQPVTGVDGMILVAAPVQQQPQDPQGDPVDIPPTQPVEEQQ